MPRDVLGGDTGGATDLSAYTGDVNITGDLTASRRYSTPMEYLRLVERERQVPQRQ
jgi:hypothetical protein